jgi:hypothetical protein
LPRSERSFPSTCFSGAALLLMADPAVHSVPGVEVRLEPRTVELRAR